MQSWIWPRATEVQPLPDEWKTDQGHKSVYV